MTKEFLFAKLEKETDWGKRLMMLVLFIVENGSDKDKNRIEQILQAAATK